MSHGVTRAFRLSCELQELHRRLQVQLWKGSVAELQYMQMRAIDSWVLCFPQNYDGPMTLATRPALAHFLFFHCHQSLLTIHSSSQWLQEAFYLAQKKLKINNLA